MLKLIIYLLFIFFFNLNYISNADQQNYFLTLKNKKVNVRFGPSLDSPIKYIYKKINLPSKSN